MYDKRILFLNSRILNLYLFGKYSNLRYIQKIFLNSLSVRFSIIRDTYLYNIRYKDYLDFRISEKFYMAVNVKLNKFTSFKDYFFSYHKKLFSLFFSTPNLYVSFIQSIYNTLILPIVDFKCDRFSFGFRPYRSSLDLFVQLKRVININSIFWSTTLRLNESFSRNSLDKSIIIDKRYLNFINSKRFYLKTDHPLYFTLFNLSLSGLVRSLVNQ